MSVIRRVLVVTNDPLTEQMPGPAIRAWHLAETLAFEHQVTLVSTVAATRTHPRMAVKLARTASELDELGREADIVVAPAGILFLWPALAFSSKVVVFDLYDPYHLENLEPTGTGTIEERQSRIGQMTAALNDHLLRGDFFLCASERQRDFWLGSLAALGRINAYTYDEDPGLGSLVEIVPFGLQSEAPVRTGPGARDLSPQIGADAQVVLWGGGVYNWFDPDSVVLAIDRLRHRLPRVRVVFLGMTHPNPAIPTMRRAVEVRLLSDRLGLTDRWVFFNEGWVPYDQRANFLLDADVGVSTHLDHIEARFSFRTRVLDYLWAGLPMVLTGGDTLSEEVQAAGLGQIVQPGDVDGIAAALEQVLARRVEAVDFAALADRYEWSSVARPLVEFCRAPRRAPDLTQDRRVGPSAETKGLAALTRLLRRHRQ